MSGHQRNDDARLRDHKPQRRIDDTELKEKRVDDAVCAQEYRPSQGLDDRVDEPRTDIGEDHPGLRPRREARDEECHGVSEDGGYRGDRRTDPQGPQQDFEVKRIGEAQIVVSGPMAEVDAVRCIEMETVYEGLDAAARRIRPP